MAQVLKSFQVLLTHGVAEKRRWKRGLGGRLWLPQCALASHAGGHRGLPASGGVATACPGSAVRPPGLQACSPLTMHVCRVGEGRSLSSAVREARWHPRHGVSEGTRSGDDGSSSQSSSRRAAGPGGRWLPPRGVPSSPSESWNMGHPMSRPLLVSVGM